MTANGSDPVSSGVPLESAETVAELIASGDVQLVDVRTDHEWAAGRIAGALHINLAELPERTGELDSDRLVIVYCRAGNRSEMATAALRDGGFDARKLDRGILGWVEEGQSLEPQDGYVAESGEAAAILDGRRRGASSGTDQAQKP